MITGAEIYLPLSGLVNVDEEIARLNKELEKWISEVKIVRGKLSNERFVQNAPEQVVAKEREKEADYLEKQQLVTEQLEQMKKMKQD